MQYKVYMMKADNFIKIGVTQLDIEERIKAVQTGCPLPITGVHYWIVSNRKQSFFIEKEIHKKISKYNTFGEWFIRNESVIKDIKEIFNIYGDFKCVKMENLTHGICHRTINKGVKSINILHEIQRCIKFKKNDKLLELHKEIENLPEKKIYDRVCKRYNEALNIMQSSYVSKEDKVKKVYDKYSFLFFNDGEKK